MQDATIKYAEDKVDNVNVNISTEIKIEVEKPIEKDNLENSQLPS